jgi:Protein of unknown function (DUF3048) N-terminal domain/Protein of unknown function (DUF3048) C-terminal domain
VIDRPKSPISRLGTRGRVLAVAIGIVAVASIVGGSLLIASDAGGTAGASAAPSLSPSPSPTATATASPSPSPTASPYPTATPDLGPTPIPSGWAYADLDGVAAPGTVAHRLPVAVMVADNQVSRPQSGISTASIVYQALADGMEDRYLMIWQEGTATDIGPARSARPYYVYWAAEYKPVYGHVGGDAHSLQQVIPSMSKYIYNMDELNGGSCAYHRITTRAAPQNDYTSTPVLLSCAATKGYPAAYQKLPTRPFTDDSPYLARPQSQTISIPYHTGTVGYQYNPVTDSYLRIVDGQPEVDPANNQQVYGRTIVVMYQAYGYDSGSLDEPNRPWVYNVGSGKATIFMEGQAVAATWKKTSTTALTRFYDSSGKEISFVRGEIFMQSVPPGTAVTVKWGGSPRPGGMA